MSTMFDPDCDGLPPLHTGDRIQIVELQQTIGVVMRMQGKVGTVKNRSQNRDWYVVDVNNDGHISTVSFDRNELMLISEAEYEAFKVVDS